MTIFRFIPHFFIVVCISCSSAKPPASVASIDINGPQRVEIGPWKARAIWTPTSAQAPAILLIPGSGPQGPEELMPASLTADGKESAIFNDFARPFIAKGFNVLQLGKPGVEFQGAGPGKFYDEKAYHNLLWNDLLENAKAGLAFLRSKSRVDASRIYILGHSEGTQIASDIVQVDRHIAGIILLGYSGINLMDTVKWQVFERDIEYFVQTDVDADKDGYVSAKEAKIWYPNFRWQFKSEDDLVSINEIKKFVANDPRLKKVVAEYQSSMFCSDGHCERPPLFDETSNFYGSIYAFTGSLDLQTRPAEAQELQKHCLSKKHPKCHIEIIPGVQHGFNLPKPPRRHPVLDIAIGPVEATFLSKLEILANDLMNGN